jgi:hypothetical protein
MGHETPTIPNYPLRAAKEKNGKPWWAAALIGGIGTGLAIAGALGLGSAPARGSEPKVVQTAVLPPGALSLDDRLKGIEGTLTTLVNEMAEMKARLPPKRP